ncbi:hypothetical protein TNCV_2991521 [Trichonephila clavipes]|uniref:Uncharacterized protein n=1 Tax=Trichonephila clavipes TaxID=2585209 RepID=A0A8X6VJ70_TRICX|nr:hypothetical protein TNCV_2991521 [Trichonephila clavipes]
MRLPMTSCGKSCHDSKLIHQYSRMAAVAFQAKLRRATSRYLTQARCWGVAAVAEWYRYRIVACLVTSSSPVPLKTRRVRQRCTLNLSRAETSSRGCGS